METDGARWFEHNSSTVRRVRRACLLLEGGQVLALQLGAKAPGLFGGPFAVGKERTTVPVPGRTWSQSDDEELARHRAMLPPHLYRYVGIRGERMAWCEEVILRARLFFPAYAKLNDPFEGGTSFEFTATPEEVRSYWEDHQRENKIPSDAIGRAKVEAFVADRLDPIAQAKLNAQVREINEACGVACFGASGDNLLMWSYYAEGHAGVCFRFRSEALSQLVNIGCFAPMPVSYEEDIPRPSFYRTSRFAKAKALLATKSKAWQHEEEWRVICLKERALDLDPTALDAVILGCRMAAEDKAQIRHVVDQRTPPVPVIEARRDESRFRIIVPE